MTIYEIRVKGYLDQRWLTWFEGLKMSYDEDGSTLLRGPLADEAALHGVLIKVRDLTIPLLSVNQVATSTGEQEQEDVREREASSPDTSSKRLK